LPVSGRDFASSGRKVTAASLPEIRQERTKIRH
jgi:hypothetical protein